MTKEQSANLIWEILVACGANPLDRSSFISYFISSVWGEFRFQGNLGFGGKFYFDEHEWRVGYYKEDFTIARETIRGNANILLSQLHKSQVSNVH